MSLNGKKILFLDEVHPILEERLKQEGASCVHKYIESVEELEPQLIDYQGVVLRSRIPIDQFFIDKAGALEFVARSGSGLENINLPYLESKGIQCFNSAEGNAAAVAEHMMGMLLCLFNNINRANTEIRNGLWQREANRGIELKGKTVALVGYGVMAKAFAKRLKGFNVEVIAYDCEPSVVYDEGAQKVSIDEIFERADVLSLHVNYKKENHHLVNDTFLHSFKKNIFLLNSSRGNVVNTKDLIDAIKKQKVLGACLDVLEIESSSFALQKNNRLLEDLSSLTNVLLSPHVAGWTDASYFKLSNILAEKIIDFYKQK